MGKIYRSEQLYREDMLVIQSLKIKIDTFKRGFVDVVKDDRSTYILLNTMAYNETVGPNANTSIFGYTMDLVLENTVVSQSQVFDTYEECYNNLKQHTNFQFQYVFD